MRIYNEKVLFGNTNKATVVATTYSDPYKLDNIYGFSVQANWKIISPVTEATVYMEGSNDDDNWNLVPDSVLNITIDDGVLYNVTEVFYSDIRLVFKVTTGELEVTGHINSKGV
jgi:hypothetical protein